MAKGRGWKTRCTVFGRRILQGRLERKGSRGDQAEKLPGQKSSKGRWRQGKGQAIDEGEVQEKTFWAGEALAGGGSYQNWKGWEARVEKNRDGSSENGKKT